MRGKLTAQHITRKTDGNIPAYAGKTIAGAGVSDSSEEHPRVCGENPTTTIPAGQSTGTSPRMRGKQIRLGFEDRSLGNIPAYAGKTCDRFYIISPIKEHPRVCGENHLMLSYLHFLLGTSPRMRGKQCSLYMALAIKGNIPAYAGKTYCRLIGFHFD